LDDIYAKPWVKNYVGDGKAAAALLNELSTGEQTAGHWHVVDVADLIARLRDLLELNRKNKITLTPGEVDIATSEVQELWNALDTADDAGNVTEYLNSHPQAATTVRNIVNQTAAAPSLASVTGSEFEERPYKAPIRVRGPRLSSLGLMDTLGGVVGAVAMVDTVVHVLKGDIPYCELTGSYCGPPPVA
jgi:hypothetical protein